MLRAIGSSGSSRFVCEHHKGVTLVEQEPSLIQIPTCGVGGRTAARSDFNKGAQKRQRELSRIIEPRVDKFRQKYIQAANSVMEDCGHYLFSNITFKKNAFFFKTLGKRFSATLNVFYGIPD